MKYELKSIKKSFKLILNLVIAFQLAVYPFISTANNSNLSKREQENLNQAENFNRKHVQSLRDFIFNTEETNQSPYKSHPLDTFGILKQEVPYKASKLVKQEKVLESLNKLESKLSGQTDKAIDKLTNSIAINSDSLTKDTELTQLINKIQKQGLTKKELDQLTTELEKLSPEEINLTTEELNSLKYQIEDQAEKKEDQISRQKIKIKNLQAKKIKDRIQAKHLFVKIFEDTKEKALQAVLSHPGQTTIAPLVLEEEQSKFKGSVYINDSQKQLSFRLSYKGQTINTFPQNIEWMAFFGDFLVFLEASKVSNKKALLSFIDLKYFEPAIGRTALPVFHIPLHFQKTGLKQEDILSPKSLSLTEDNKLNLGQLSLSLNQINYLSQLNQLSFNVTVSLLDPASAQMSQKYLREIVDNFEQSAKDFVNLEDQKAQNISLDTKKLVLRLLENRRQIGSSKDISGKYGKLNKAEATLSFLNEENKIVNEFKDNLTADKNFQKAVDVVAKQMNEQKKFYHRFFLFLNHISHPQPLGAPKIEKALGLIANSVSLKNDSIENRFLAFKSALSHALYKPSKHRSLTTGVLVGAGMIASPEFANYSLVALNTMGHWFANWGNLFTITGQAGTEWVSADGLYNAYLKGDKPFHLMKGLVALFGAGLGIIGGMHLSSNFYDLVKHFRSTKGKAHQQEVSGFLNKLKNTQNEFIEYMAQNKKDFVHNLSNAEKKKLGIPIKIKLGSNQIESSQLLKTVSNLDSLYSILESKKRLSLEITAKKEDQSLILEFISSTESGVKLKDNQLSLSLSHDNKEVTKVFNLTDGDLNYLLSAEDSKINPDLSLNIDLSRKDNHISGVLENADFTLDENERLIKVLTQIEVETGKALISSDDFLSQEKIKTLKQAIAHLLLGYSSWAKTFRFVGLGWNWFFYTRSMYLSPITFGKTLYFSKYFKTIHEDKHLATVFNGGMENRLSRFLHVNNITNKETSLKALKEFENKVIEIEKLFLKEVKAQAYLELVKLTGESSTEITTVSKGSKLQAHDIKDKRLRAFYGIYKRELFIAVMQDYLLDLTDSKNNKTSDRFLKSQSLKKFVTDESLFNKKPSQTEIRQRVERVAQERQIAQQSLQATDNLINGMLKRVVTKREEASKKALDPKRNRQMERFNIAKKMLNDPEALARATRQQTTYFLVDKPIELIFTFLFLAGVDQGILQILHDQPFTEEAWFHLSRYTVWSGFFAGLALEILAGVWMKVQQDARLDDTKGFDLIPNKKDANKKLGAVKWLYKQFNAEDNTLIENYKYSWRIIIANIPAALVTMTVIWSATLGRFDLELFISGYLILIFPFMGFNYKLENAFEKSANWSLKELIKRDLDLKEKDKRFLSHPAIQQIKIKESSKLRRKFNLWLALLYNNPAGNMVDIFQNVNNSLGSRGFARMFFPGNLPTEYWVNFMDFLENKKILSSDFAETCRKAFTNNRTDL